MKGGTDVEDSFFTMTATTHPYVNTLADTQPTTAAGLPNPDTDPQTKAQHAYELLKEIDTVMLLSFERYDGPTKHEPKFNARPMHVAALDPDCTIWFVTSIDSEKVDEALTPHDGYAVAQTKTRQASIRGTFTVVRDRDQIKQVWSPAYDVWFPQGADDPRACLLGLHPREIEFWDASGMKGLTYLLESAKAFMTGETPKPAPEQHEKVRLA